MAHSVAVTCCTASSQRSTVSLRQQPRHWMPSPPLQNRPFAPLDGTGTGRVPDYGCLRRLIVGYPMERAVCHTIRTGFHMASLDWSQCAVVESIPGKVSGAWVFRGTRVPVSAIFENLKCSSVDEVLENFHVTREQVQAVLDFAAKSAVPPAEPSRAA